MKPLPLLHSCQHTNEIECVSCCLIDLSILVLYHFDKRPDYYGDSVGQELIKKALTVKIAIEEARGVMRTKHGIV